MKRLPSRPIKRLNLESITIFLFKFFSMLYVSILFLRGLTAYFVISSWKVRVLLFPGYAPHAYNLVLYALFFYLVLWRRFNYKAIFALCFVYGIDEFLYDGFNIYSVVTQLYPSDHAFLLKQIVFVVIFTFGLGGLGLTKFTLKRKWFGVFALLGLGLAYLFFSLNYGYTLESELPLRPPVFYLPSVVYLLFVYQANFVYHIFFLVIWSLILYNHNSAKIDIQRKINN